MIPFFIKNHKRKNLRKDSPVGSEKDEKHEKENALKSQLLIISFSLNAAPLSCGMSRKSKIFNFLQRIIN